MISGSRTYCVDVTGQVDYKWATKKAWPKLDKFMIKIMKMEGITDHRDIILVQGGNAGAEAICRAYATDKEMICMTVPAQWRRKGKTAERRQIKELFTKLDVSYVLAFWDQESASTGMLIRAAKKFGIQTKTFKIGGRE